LPELLVPPHQSPTEPSSCRTCGFFQSWPSLSAIASVVQLDPKSRAGRLREVVQATFHRWRQSPPRGDADIAARIESATKDAGWELTGTGGRRPLYHSKCSQLISVDTAPAADSPGPMSVVTPHGERCGWCGRQLVRLFDIDLRDPQLTSLAPGWSRLRIAMCERCTGYDREAPAARGAIQGGGNRQSPLECVRLAAAFLAVRANRMPTRSQSLPRGHGRRMEQRWAGRSRESEESGGKLSRTPERPAEPRGRPRAEERCLEERRCPANIRSHTRTQGPGRGVLRTGPT
jgi:hypothetical protein